MLNMSRADFDNPQVAAAANPSAFGHHHGRHILSGCPVEADLMLSMQDLCQIPMKVGRLRALLLLVQLAPDVSISIVYPLHMLTIQLFLLSPLLRMAVSYSGCMLRIC
jgi:hypothetical protein